MEIKPVDPEFGRVWHRVTQAEGEALIPEGIFAAAIQGELGRLSRYWGLGFVSPARECARRVAQLRRVAFFLEGTIAPAQPTQPVSGPAKELLRGLFLAEGAAEQRYRSLAAGMTDPILARALYHCADSCARTRQFLWQAVK